MVSEDLLDLHDYQSDSHAGSLKTSLDEPCKHGFFLKPLSSLEQPVPVYGPRLASSGHQPTLRKPRICDTRFHAHLSGVL